MTPISPGRNLLLTVGALALLILFLCGAHSWANDYQVRLLNTTAIFMTMAVSYNLINGVCGQLHLGPNAFVTLGAYTAALLTLTPAEKQLSFIITPLFWPLNQISVSFPLALLAGGLVAVLFAFITGFPVLRVRGDYLAIVTLGFGEVIRVLANNLQSVTNGPLGLKGLAPYTNLWWSWGVAVVALAVITGISNSGFGRAMKAIRADETATRAMGIDPFRHLLLAFLVSAFFLGVAGGLLAHLITTISPTLFTFLLTFNLLIIIVFGGLGSITGSVVATIILTWGNEWLRIVEEPINLGGVHLPGIPGLRMVIFSLLLLIIIIFFRRGLLGRWEFSWDWLLQKSGKVAREKWQVRMDKGEIPLLSANAVHMTFGGLMALNNFSLELTPGELHGLIGPNGAGKTTVFNLLSGFYQPTDGEIILNGAPITGLPPQAIARLGIARTFQNIRLFPGTFRPGQCPHSFPQPFSDQLLAGSAAQSPFPAGRKDFSSAGRGIAGKTPIAGSGPGKGRPPALWPAAPPGDCPGPGCRSPPSASG